MPASRAFALAHFIFQHFSFSAFQHFGGSRLEGRIVAAEEDVIDRRMVVKAHFILYVSDQGRSAAFYRQVLDVAPVLDVPGMTEFYLSDSAVLGLMPEAGIRRLLVPALDATPTGRDTLRAELYLLVEDAAACHRRALSAGAEELSPLKPRDWGHAVAYSRDPDGYVLAFSDAVPR